MSNENFASHANAANSTVVAAKPSRLNSTSERASIGTADIITMRMKRAYCCSSIPASGPTARGTFLSSVSATVSRSTPARISLSRLLTASRSRRRSHVMLSTSCDSAKTEPKIATSTAARIISPLTAGPAGSSAGKSPDPA